MRKSIAIILTVMLIICIIPFEMSDADADETMHFRVSKEYVYHFTGKANVTTTVTEFNAIIYEEGQDSSMKAYINDPSHMATPAEGIRTIEKDKLYEVYYFGMFESSRYFDHAGPEEQVLDKYDYRMTVAENTTKIVTVKSIDAVRTDWTTGVYLIISSMTEGSSSYVSKSLIGGMTTKMGYEKDGYYQVEAPYGNSTFYIDVTFDVQILHYDASPIPFIIASIVIVAIIGGLIAFCGRRPKFD